VAGTQPHFYDQGQSKKMNRPDIPSSKLGSTNSAENFEEPSFSVTEEKVGQSTTESNLLERVVVVGILVVAMGSLFALVHIILKGLYAFERWVLLPSWDGPYR
jgi:hypothetical protein